MKKSLVFIGLILQLAVTTIGCGIVDARGAKGDSGAIGAPGVDGRDGVDGVDGTDGLPGRDGRDGLDSIIEVIDPCGNATSKVDEVLLRLSTGELLVLFADNSSGKNPRLAIIESGTYVTTDGTNCVFTVDSDGQVSF